MKKQYMPVILVWVAVLVGGQGVVLGQTADELAKSVGDGLRMAQSKFFNGQLDEAQAQLTAAEENLVKLRATAPEHKQLAGLEAKATKLRKDLDAKLAQKTGGKADKSAVPAPGASQPQTDAAGGKIPGAVKNRLMKMEQSIQQAQGKLDEKNPLNPHLVPGSARGRLEAADYAWGEIKEKYPDSLQLEEVKQAGARLEEMHAQIDALEKQIQQGKEQAAAQGEAQAAECKAWEEKLFPFVARMSEPGYDGKKALIASYTEEAEEMARRQEVYAQAAEVYKEYQKAQFPNGQTEKLKDYAERMGKVLADFDKMLQESTQWLLSELNTEMDGAMKRLKENEEKCKDKTAVPVRVDNDQLMYMQKKLDRAKNLSPQNPRIGEAEKKLADLQTENAKWLEFMVAQVRVKPDTFKGEEAQALKDKAVAIMKEKNPKAEVLRTSLISEGWKEERVVEYTDTTRSALRHRVTRFLTAQVAAKTAEGCRLFTVYLAQDQMTGGQWGSLYGHIMFTDKILEENVSK